ncbi:hypothetical protein GGR56DRAFT_674302 [Xylariaceae sp. FL0804]|nr:hypothetical protein GGR56DRAFT_674302 [Xylariaceae sp. FL0804]
MTTRPTSPAPTPSQIPLPTSPAFSYASTAAPLSAFSLALPPPPPPPPAWHTVLTKADLEQSQLAYADLLATAKAYRQALAALSTAASAFGSALEACARLKEARADPLNIVGGGGLGGPASSMHVTSSHGGGGADGYFGARSEQQQQHAGVAAGGGGGGDAGCTADLLLSTSGVHHLIANHQQILSETVYRSFEVPLLHELDRWRRDVDDEDEAYRREAAARAKEIRRLEKEGLRMHRLKRRRDVSEFRAHLVELTGRLDDLTALHGSHARATLRASQEVGVRIVDAGSSLVRAEVDIFEGLARKGWAGGGLDDLLERGRDLFAAGDDDDDDVGQSFPLAHHRRHQQQNGGAADGAKLFSILPPRSILADSASDDQNSGSGGGGGGGGGGGRGRPAGSQQHRRADSLLMVDGDRYQSLAGAVDQPSAAAAADDVDSIFSEFRQQQHPARGVRPFSPQPIRRRATDVVMDPESLLQPEEEREREDVDGEDNEGEGDGERDGDGDRDGDDGDEHDEEEWQGEPAGEPDRAHSIWRDDEFTTAADADADAEGKEEEGRLSSPAAAADLHDAAASLWGEEEEEEEEEDARSAVGDGEEEEEERRPAVAAMLLRQQQRDHGGE